MSIPRDDYVSVLEDFYGDWPGTERVLSACADALVALHEEGCAPATPSRSEGEKA